MVGNGIQLDRQSGMPVYHQIITQLTFMIESGDLEAGASLPSARLLADNLGVNRNTVARAYAELRERGLVESRGRGGTAVAETGPDEPGFAARDRARAVLGAAVAECVELGLSTTEIQTLAATLAVRAEENQLKICFVECNADRAGYFADEFEERLGLRVKPLVLGEFEAGDEPADLVLTTFFHLAAVRGLWDRRTTEVVGIVVAPHIQTLVQIASVPQDRTVGIYYTTDDQAAGIRDSLVQSGITNIRVLTDAAEADLADIDLAVVPTEMPDLASRLQGRVEVIEFGNVLDDASLRMVTEVVADMRAAKQQARTV
ncbi:GntR family transcriptional regulator [Streptomyces sp. NPDC088387]|uniref:GntR family transcriptional regulator n=1 Tax=Streptomyces sp. NPDC088387 TaxID=3365859 RepID=UPI00380E6655